MTASFSGFQFFTPLLTIVENKVEFLPLVGLLDFYRLLLLRVFKASPLTLSNAARNTCAVARPVPSHKLKTCS